MKIPKPKITKKKVIIGIIILAIIGIIANKVLNPPDISPIVQTGKIEQKNLMKTLDVKGIVEPNDSAEITSNYNEKVTNISVKEGDIVKKGQLLATLDNGNILNEIQILQKQVNLGQLRYNEQLQNANDISDSTVQPELAVKDAQSALDEAIRQEEIKKTLYDNGAIPQEEYTQSTLAKERAISQLTSAKEALEKGKADIANAKKNATPKNSELVSLDITKTQLQQRRQKLEDLKIKSPIDGVVTRVYAKIGRSAVNSQTAQAMFVVEDISTKYIKANISEFNIKDIKLDQEVKITAEVLGNDEIKGKVISILPTGETEAGSNNKVIPIKILVNDTDNRLLSGVTAKAKIIMDKADNVYSVPFTAIGTKDNEKYIFALEKKDDTHYTVKKIPVKTGLESDFETAITSDKISKDMEIVASVDDTLEDGMMVRKEQDQVKPQDKNSKQQPQKEDSK